jgi:6-pyruvoyltetrahydropterin/6-carboxytetrahydropterin synthase
MNKMRVAIYRKGHFNAAHRLFNPQWTEAKNREIFGICSNANFHGHNYELEVKVTGEVNNESGMVMDLKTLKELIELHVEQRFDHKNLNLDCPEFIHTIPTTENICVRIYEILREIIDPNLDVVIRLYETPRNFAEYPA